MLKLPVILPLINTILITLLKYLHTTQELHIEIVETQTLVS